MCIYISEKKSLSCLLILSNGGVIKYHKCISVVVIELSVRCLNTGPEDRLGFPFTDHPRLIAQTGSKREAILRCDTPFYPDIYIYLLNNLISQRVLVNRGVDGHQADRFIL